MNQKIQHYGLIVIRIFLTLVFVGAGGAKLTGVDMMVEIYETLGFGQWFRYVTGVVEVGSALLLWLPGKQAWGAGLLVCTMISALFANLFLLNSGALPAIVLGGLAAVVLFAYREQLPKLG